jgi:hypothetical protein
MDRRSSADRNAGRGHSYEALYRALLLIKLREGERLELYEPDGEDAQVVRPDGSRTVYQFKSGVTSGEADKLKPVLAHAQAKLSASDRDEFVLVTEERLSTSARSALDTAMDSEWGKDRFRYRRVPSAADVRSRAYDVLLKLLGGSDVARPSELATIAELDAVVDAAIGHVTVLAYPPDGRPAVTTAAAASSALNVDELRSSCLARIIGDRLVPWTVWVEEARRSRDGVTAPWALALEASWSFTATAEKSLIATVQTWLAGNQDPAVVLVGGRSGTGKTWCLAHTGRRLSTECDVYVLDDRQASMPDFERLTRLSQRPVIVLADNIRHEDITRSIRLARSAGLLLIATAGCLRQSGRVKLSLPRDWELLREDLDTRVRIQELADTIDPDDKNALVQAAGRHLTARLSREMNVNLRTAAKMVARNAPGSTRRQLVELIEASGDEAAVAMRLLIASAVGVRIPRTILTRSSGRARIPAQIDALVQHRRLSDGTVLVWFEQQAAVAALEIAFREMGQSDVVTKKRGEYRALIATVELGQPDERRFARQLLQAIGSPEVAALVVEQGEYIGAIAEADSRTDFAYGWLAALAQHLPLDLLRRLAASAQPPRDRADVLILAAVLDNEEVARAVTRAIPTATWEVGPWAATFDALGALSTLDRLPERTRRRVERLTMTAANNGALDLDGLLRQGKAAPSFVTAVIRSGPPQFRLRTHTALMTAFAGPQPPLGLLKGLFDLTERCAMQERSLLTLNLVRLITANRIRAADLDGARNELAALRAQSDAIIESTLACTLEVVRRLGEDAENLTRAADPWALHCRFARRAGRPEAGYYQEAITLAHRLTSRRAATPVFLEAVRGLAQVSPAVPAELRSALTWFAERRESVLDLRAFIVLAATLTQTDDTSLNRTAAGYLRTLATGPAASLAERTDRLRSQVQRWSDVRIKPPVSLGKLLSATIDETVVNEYLVVARHVETGGQSQVPEATIIQLAKGRSARAHMLAFNELFRRVDRPAVAAMRAQLQRAGASEGSVDSVIRWASFHARYGRLDEANRLVALGCDRQANLHGGASPHSLHRAFRALANREEGIRSAAYALAAQAMFIGPSTAIDEPIEDD